MSNQLSVISQNNADYSPFFSLLSRSQINDVAWDACVAASPQRIVYGYSWYLDAVLPAPDWKWMGVVLTDEAGHYRAVMPVPLRRKTVAGLTYEWVVHQPFFCQFLAVFSRDTLLDINPFFGEMLRNFRYGSVFCSIAKPDEYGGVEVIQCQSTHTLDLSADYSAIYQRFSHDRKLNLRRAIAANWNLVHSGNPELLLILFRENHANTIEGGVAEWAYDLFRRLMKELSQRGLVTIHYAMREGKLEAGAVFVQEGNRIIYLFNAASEAGRQGNARTLLIDRVIQEQSGKPLILDFESPTKPSIRDFYRSFGAVEEIFWQLSWNRLSWAEQMVVKISRL